MFPTRRSLLLLLTTTVLALAQDDFSRRLTPEERKASGLDRLSPEQIAVLDALVQRDRQKSDGPVAVQPAAASVAPAAAPAAPPEVENKPDQKRRLFGLPVKEEMESITGTLVGEYRGWSGSTVFRLADGQVWVQSNTNDTFYVAPQQNPKVKIEKSKFGGYKLTVEGSSVWVRVRRLQ